MKYSAAIVFSTTSCLSLSPPLFSFPHHFFLCDGLVFSHWASTPLAAGAVQYCHSSICRETQIREGTEISGQWALEACNTKPVMEVSLQTAIDVPWDSMSQNKQTNTTCSSVQCGHDMWKQWDLEPNLYWPVLWFLWIGAKLFDCMQS